MKSIFIIGAVLYALPFIQKNGNEPTQTFFDGMSDAESKAVMIQAEKEIEKYRTADFKLLFLDEEGKKVDSKKVKLELFAHEFDFGTNTYGLFEKPANDPIRIEALKTIPEIFNKVVICDYWQDPKTRQRDYKVLEAIKWAQKNDLRMRFHAVLYNEKWFKNQIYTEDQIWQMIEDRLHFVGETYGDKIGEYDVINEFYSMQFWERNNPPEDQFILAAPNYPKYREPEVAKKTLSLARKYLPNAKFVVLDAQHPYLTNPQFIGYVNYLKTLKSIDGDFQMAGNQDHFFGHTWDFRAGSPTYGKTAYTMGAINKGFELLGTIGKPIVITEFNGPSRNNKHSPENRDKIWTISDKENSAWQINYYTLAFSKPFIIGVTRWYQVDNLGGRGMDAGILYEDGRKHQIYYDLKKLIKETWHTKTEKKTSMNGEVTFHGFYGDYLVDIPGYETVRVKLYKDGSKTTTVILKKAIK